MLPQTASGSAALGIERGGDFLERARRAIEQVRGKRIGRGRVEHQRCELGIGILARSIAPAQQRLARCARHGKDRTDQRADGGAAVDRRDASRASRAIRAMRRCLRRRREIPSRRRPRADRRGAMLRRRCRCRPRRSRRGVLRVHRARSYRRQCPARSERTAARGAKKSSQRCRTLAPASPRPNAHWPRGAGASPASANA